MAAQDLRAPAPTITAGGTHLAEVRAFLVKYYGQDSDQRVEGPLHTITTKHRFGLVTVHGTNYVIANIGMYMLQPHELFRATSFRAEYIIDLDFDGRPLTKTAQVRMVGNAVPPLLAAGDDGSAVRALGTRRRGRRERGQEQDTPRER